MPSQPTAVDSGRAPAGPERQAGLAHGVVLVSVTWLAVVAAGVLAPVLPQMADHFAGVPRLGLMIGFVATIPALAVALFSVPIGQMSDRIGARRILVVGMSGYGLAGILPLWLDSLSAIVASRFLVGVFEAAVMTASTTLISLYFTGLQRDRWLAVQVASTNVMGVIVVLAGGLAGEHGWRAPFFAYAIAIVLLLPVIWVTYEPARVPRADARPFDAPAEPSWIRLVAVRCALTFFVSVTVYTLIVQFGFLLVERGVTDPSTIGLGISFGAGGVAMGSIANTAMLAISSRYRLAASWVLIAGGLGLVAVDAGFAAMCLGALMAGLGAGCTVSTLLCITVADVPAALKGRATGAWTAAMFLGQFLNPPIFLVLVHLGGSHAGAFLLYAGICAAIAIAAGVHTAMAWRRTRADPLGQAR
ncbi:MAG: transporter [Sphingomonas bacterium]|uniref:MFS transporter n=1 Tax=Sphingomonas bacterium TaxID=1895847 RepID=UPI00262F5B32|nr:MFS transporter [Sphingomonas bacterium]MDB5704084.1 transporter [Sphingomonas bacterium]